MYICVYDMYTQAHTRWKERTDILKMSSDLQTHMHIHAHPDKIKKYQKKLKINKKPNV